MATLFSTLAWKIPWTEEPGGLQSMGLPRVRYDRVIEDTHTHNRHLKLLNLALFCVWKDARVWAHWNHSFDIHLTCLEPVSFVCPS